MASFNQFRRVLSIPNGNPFSFHSQVTGLGGTGFLEPGELGGVLPWQGHQFQLVQMDSGATSATATGVPAAGQLLFWKDRTNYLVTNDGRFADVTLLPSPGPATRDFRYSVAGVLEAAAVAGDFIFAHQKGSSGVVGKDGGAGVKSSSSPNVGDVFVANTGTAADAVSVAAGTAAIPSLGNALSPTAVGGKFPAILNVEFID